MLNGCDSVGVGVADVGEVWDSFESVMDSDEGATLSPDPWLLVRVGLRMSSTLDGSELIVPANCGPDGVEEEDVVCSTRVREREDEREETTLRTRSRRLLVEDEVFNERWFPSTPRVLLEVGVGVGMPLSDAGAGEVFRLDKAAGRLRLPRSFDAEVLLCSLRRELV